MPKNPETPSVPSGPDDKSKNPPAETTEFSPQERKWLAAAGAAETKEMAENRPIDSRAFADEEQRRLGDALSRVLRTGGVLRRLKPFGKLLNAWYLSSVIAGALRPSGAEEIGSIGEAAATEAENSALAELGAGATEAEMKTMARQDAKGLIVNFDDFRDVPQVEDVVLNIASNTPEIVVENLVEFQNEPYFGDLVTATVEGNPELAYRILKGTYSIPEADRALLIDGISQSDDPTVCLFEQIAQSDLSKSEARALIQILPAIEQNGWTLDDARGIVSDDHRYAEALFDSQFTDSPGLHQRTLVAIENSAENLVMHMNLAKGRTDRFEDVEGASAKELYSLIVFGGHRGRPSTMSPLYDRFLISLHDEGTTVPEFLDGVRHAEYVQFVNIAEQNGKLDDVLERLDSPEARHDLLKKFVTEAGDSRDPKAIMSASETIMRLKNEPFGDDIKDLIRVSYEEAHASGDHDRELAFGFLSGLYQKEAAWLENREKEFTLEPTETLAAERLFNERKENIQVHYFYNDEDGKSAYTDFVWKSKQEGWTVTDHDTFIEIASPEQEGRKILIFANKPETAKNGEEDLVEAFELSGRSAGVDDLKEYLAETDRTPHVETHRGHSYFAGDTISELSPETAVVIDGGCGGGGRVADIKLRSPNAQVVFNTETGMRPVNDSIMLSLNEAILTGQDVRWDDVHQDAERRVQTLTDWPEAPSGLTAYVFPGDERALAIVAGDRYRLALEQSDV